MQRTLLILIGLLLLTVTSLFSDPNVYQTRGQMQVGVREKIRNYGLNLADSVVTRCVKEAVLETSVHVGGVEAVHKFMTVGGQAFYTIPDSIVRVLFGVIRTSDGRTMALKSWYQQFYDIFNLPKLTGTDNDAVPLAYNYWAGQVEISPAPTKGDTVYLMCYAAHGPIATDSSTLHFRPGYADAAVLLAAQKALLAMGEDERSSYFLALFDSTAAKLSGMYTRQFDVTPAQIRPVGEQKP